MGIIDFCVDYLRLGRGECFIVISSLLCVGNKVVVVCVELYNEE